MWGFYLWHGGIDAVHLTMPSWSMGVFLIRFWKFTSRASASALGSPLDSCWRGNGNLLIGRVKDFAGSGS